MKFCNLMIDGSSFKQQQRVCFCLKRGQIVFALSRSVRCKHRIGICLALSRIKSHLYEVPGTLLASHHRKTFQLAGCSVAHDHLLKQENAVTTTKIAVVFDLTSRCEIHAKAKQCIVLSSIHAPHESSDQSAGTTYAPFVYHQWNLSSYYQ